MTLEIEDAQASAEDAALRYVTDTVPGVRRRGAGKGFGYIGTDGERITDADRIAWFKSLAIPPAWTDVGSAPSGAVTSRPPDATLADGSSTAITRAGARGATRRNTGA